MTTTDCGRRLSRADTGVGADPPVDALQLFLCRARRHSLITAADEIELAKRTRQDGVADDHRNTVVGCRGVPGRATYGGVGHD